MQSQIIRFQFSKRLAHKRENKKKLLEGLTSLRIERLLDQKPLTFVRVGDGLSVEQLVHDALDTLADFDHIGRAVGLDGGAG